MAEARKTEQVDPETHADTAAGSVPGTGHPATAAEQEDAFDLDAHIDGLIAERDDLKDKLLRALAEAENIRKRAERDRREAERYGATRLARDLTPFYDNLRRALDSTDEEQRKQAPALIEGVELTLRELLSTFERHSIQRISPEVGMPFDPQLHQAMFEAPVPGATPGTIIQVMADGFLLHDRLLRAAQVGVASGTPTQG